MELIIFCANDSRLGPSKAEEIAEAVNSFDWVSKMEGDEFSSREGKLGFDQGRNPW